MSLVLTTRLVLTECGISQYTSLTVPNTRTEKIQMSDNLESNFKWYMLALLTITGTFVGAIPFSCMPVLFKEISDDLSLDLVQIGTIWGISSLAGVFVSLIGGVLSDKFGVKVILTVFCIMVGITGSLRGLSESFFALTATVFINGLVRMVIPVTVTKTVGLWFKGPRLGMAMGISAMGVGLGLMLGPLISATVLSPLLGGWRNVMHLYGGISVIIGLLWLLFGRVPHQFDSDIGYAEKVPLGKAVSRLIRNKALWLIGLTLLFRMSGMMGMTGYLPLYLRGQGWTEPSADGTLATFYAVSALCVVPLSLLSDRLGSRKAIIFPALISAIICIGLLPLVGGVSVWLLIIFAGAFFDGYMAITTTMLLETEGVGVEYSGTALGIAFTIAQIGSVVSPPLGNSFAAAGQGVPFHFWAALSVVALVIFSFVKETGRRRTKAVKS
jgi:NNP family nitrate/nitrite transporter-like MFS transporter